MRSPMFWGLIYLLTGVLFTYLAATSPGNMWSFYTVLLMLFAAYNISISIKMFVLSSKLNRKK
ncbi:YdiK family protein [Bacillus sp. CLL-7-23]|uniref:YdiK family protein n=1 Tax=Bacillus changyiensis TaxID=3004103 RepID=A0ABT4XAY0_9BACI|nr:YdiK family protein [Bacillus changyiensis]MDA7028582.1 YdiK family protein [Bacillus changyiensis]